MKYILNKNIQMTTGYHKIHMKDCPKGPQEKNTIDLKECICSIEAKNRAREYYSNVNGCKYCCKEIFYQNEKSL